MNFSRCKTLVLAAVILIADQTVKQIVAFNLDEGGGFAVIAGLFDIRYVRNPGAAWGIFAGHRWPLIAAAFIALGVFVFYAERMFGHLKVGSITLALLIGGIVGNLIDRAVYGYVIDYLDFYWGRSHFPAFNIADSAICVGAGLMILTQWLYDRRKN